MRTKNLYKSRKWLNKDRDRTAFIACYVDRDRWENDSGEEWTNTTGEIKIADCGKIIHLDLFCSNKKEHRNALHKLDTLITELENVRAVIEGECNE